MSTATNGHAMTPDAPSSPPPPQKTVSQVLGEITWLLTQSPMHKSMFISDLEWMIMPAVLFEQFRIFHAPDERPVGLILWGSVSDDTEQRLLRHDVKLSPQEWRGGDNLWLIEMIAPFGGSEEMLADAAATIFKGKAFKYQRMGPNGAEVITHSPTGD